MKRVPSQVDGEIRTVRKAILWGVILTVMVEFLLGRDLQAVPLPPLRRVNAPYFNGAIQYSQTAIFWFGRVNSTENYADVRVGYDDTELYINLAAFDRYLWYKLDPSPADLEAWDAVTLYVQVGESAGGAPDANTYKLVGQLDWWETPRSRWQAAYRGSSSGWTAANVPFTTETGWRGDAPNNNSGDDRGWSISFHVPFASLGLSSSPPPGTLWRMAVALHDRDDAVGTPIPDMVWPDRMVPNQLGTWGQLRFGLPIQTPPPSLPSGIATIRNGLNGAVVKDAAVGSTIGNMCPGDSNDIWNRWANFKDPHGMQFNVQNQGDISDWPCFAKYFVTFPLSALPAGKVIISATLTLHQFGNAGQGWYPPPEPSYLQVFTIGEDWSEETLTWSNAPLARENIAGAWVDPLPGYGGDPGLPRTWDIGSAVAEAYSAGEPLRLAVYSSDWAYHSGRYFWSSDHDDWHPEARPALTVAWGEPLAAIHYTVWPVAVSNGEVTTYTLSWLGSGRRLTLTSSLPWLVSDPLQIQVTGGGVASYDSDAHRVGWMGTPGAGQAVALTFPVTVLIGGPRILSSMAVLTDSMGIVTSATANFLVDPYQTLLPVVRK